MAKKKTIQRITQRGGDVIGSGGYGCVVYPNIACKGWKSSKDYIGKLVSRKTAEESPENRITDELGIRDIPNYRDYFAIVEDVCELDEPIEKFTMKQISDVQSCMKTMKLNRMEDLRQYIQPYGGVTFTKYRNSNKDESVSTAVRMYLRLLLALHALNDHGVVHMDIKNDNIVILGDQLRLIDFGLSIHTDDKKNLRDHELFLRYFPNLLKSAYPPWTPELYVFNYDGDEETREIQHSTRMTSLKPYLHGQLNATAKNTFYELQSRYSKLFLQYFEYDAEKIQKSIEKIEKIQDEKLRIKIISEWKQNVNETLDVYSAGIIIVKDMDFLIKRNRDKYTEEEFAFIDELYKYVLKNMTRIFCKYRNSFMDCLTDINDICKRHNVSLA